MQRPTGITISLEVSDRLGAADVDSHDAWSVLELDLDFRGNPVVWIGLIGAGVSLFKLSAAAGLWTLKPWGRRPALVSGMLQSVTHFVGVIRGSISPSGVVGLLVNSAVLIYLSRPRVRHALSSVPIDAPVTTP